jgi:4-alpha-glucanotransferase
MNPSILQGRRISGVNIALYGVRSERNWGVGDFTDLKGIIDWAAEELMVDFVGLNPLHAIFNAQPYNTSPYNPSSRFYRNYLYLDVEAIPDFMESEEANEYVKKIKAQGVTKKLRDSEHVAYEEVSRLKLTVLGRLFKAFLQNHLTRGTDYASEFSSYERSQGIYLERFAIFSALREKFVSMAEPIYDWREWPDGLNDSRSDQVRRFAEENRNEVTFWKYLQWQIERQLSPAQQHCMDKGMMVGLYHDLALGVDGYGADAWAEPGFYLQDFSVGAPPDPFAPEGQNWGFPAPNGAAVRRAGYEPFLKMLNCGLDHGGAARIDHVMQLRRLFWIPKTRPAKEGVYVSENESDLMNIIALQSCRECSIIVGEDLGTVPPDFREKMMEKGILSYRLFYFEEDSSGRMRSHHEYPRQALVSINTHDLPTFVGFWSERDIQTRVEIGQLSQEDEIAFRKDREGKKAKIIEKLVREGFLSPDLAHEAWESATPTVALHEAALSFLMRSPSYMVLINQEDALEDSRQQNLPGAVTERLNWVTKMRFSLEQLRSDPEALRLSERFRKLAIANHRAIRRAAD